MGRGQGCPHFLSLETHMSKPTTYTEFLNLYLYLDRDDVRHKSP